MDIATISAPAPRDIGERHYRAGHLSLHLSVKEQWARVIGAEFSRQVRESLITRDALMKRLGDKSSWQFRRDLSAISKIGTRHGDVSALPGLNRLLSFASALGIPPAALSPPSNTSASTGEQVAA